MAHGRSKGEHTQSYQVYICPCSRIKRATGIKKMRKRSRPEFTSDRRRTLILMVALVNDVSAIFPISMHNHNRPKPWGVEKGTNVRKKHCRRMNPILQCRGGARGWDQPDLSDYSNNEEGNNFLPRENRQGRFDPDPDESEPEGELLGSPFLESFQREIHNIVSDYRQEVSETFQHLLDDVRVRTQESISPTRRSNRDPVEQYPDEFSEVEESVPTGRSNRAHMEQYPDEYSEDDDDDMSFGQEPIRREKESTDEDSDEDDDIFSGDEGEMVFPVRDEWNNNVEDTRSDPWNGQASKQVREYSNDEDSLPVARRSHHPQYEEYDEDDRGTYYPNHPHSKTTKSKKKRKKKRKSSSKMMEDPWKPQTSEESKHVDSTSQNLGPSPTPDVAATPVSTDTALANTQLWKSMAVAVSFLAIALLLNLGIQILSRMLWRRPQLPGSPI